MKPLLPHRPIIWRALLRRKSVKLPVCIILSIQEELFNILDRRLLQNKQIVFVGDNDLERIPGLGIEQQDCLSEGLYQGCFGAIREKVREKEKPPQGNPSF